MPQAESSLQDKMISKFGSIDDGGPTNFLIDAGYILERDWHWKPKEGVSSYDDMTQDEYDCLLFLCHEWDFGGLVKKEI